MGIEQREIKLKIQIRQFGFLVAFTSIEIKVLIGVLAQGCYNTLLRLGFLILVLQRRRVLFLITLLLLLLSICGEGGNVFSASNVYAVYVVVYIVVRFLATKVAMSACLL